MTTGRLAAVTGAFSYSGRYIARELLQRGYRVITLTGHPDRPHPFGESVRAFPYSFDGPEALAASLEGVHTLYNTYWVRFDRGAVSYQQAIANTRLLIQAAQAAGVQRLVHLSVSNPPPDSPFPYFAGKYQLEQDIRGSGLSFGIVRPTLVYAPEDILVNNMAYLLRRLPLFAIPGNGQYRLQPVHAADMAAIAVQAGEARENLVWDAAGPDVFTFEELLRLIAAALDRRVWFVHVSPAAAYLAARVLGVVLGDMLITQHEIGGLMTELLISSEAPRGRLRFPDWLARNAASLGQRYASELVRHF